MRRGETYIIGTILCQDRNFPVYRVPWGLAHFRRPNATTAAVLDIATRQGIPATRILGG